MKGSVLARRVAVAVGVLQAAAVSAGSGGATPLEEVIVTALLRETDVSRTPATVAVIPGAKVDRLQMRTIDEAAQQVSSLVVSASGNTTPWIFLRGVGSNDINANAAGAVGIYQDDIYMNSTAAQLQQLYDLERVEVLKGPQGTLYGRNTTGGVINLVSMKPQPVTSAEIRAGYGRYAQLDLTAIGNVAINDELAARVAAVRHTRDPLFENANGTGDGTDIDNWAARGALRYRSGDQDWLLSVYGSSVDELAAEFDKSLIAQYPDRADVGVPRSEPLTRPGYDKVDILGSTLRGTAELQGMELTSITGFLNSRRDTRVDIDSSAPDWLDQRRDNEATQYTQEFRLASQDGGPLQWIVGAHYFLEDMDATVLLRANAALGLPALTFLSETHYSQRDTSWAVFGDATWQFANAVSLFGGARYTFEQKDFRTSQQGYFNAPYADGSQSEDWHRPTGCAGIGYTFSADAIGYLRVDHGFRAGGFNAGGGVNDPDFDPEYVDTYEAGIKMRLARQRAQLNVAVFASDYRDMQVYALVAGPGGIPVQYLTNAARASTRGAEVQIDWRPVERFRIALTASLLDTDFDDYVDGSGIDRSGNRLAGAPERTASVSIGYDFPLGRGATLSASADGSYRSRFYFDTANTDRFAAGARTLAGARIEYSSSHRRFSAALWGRNLTDEVYFERATSFLNLDSITVGTPRTVGVEIAFRI